MKRSKMIKFIEGLFDIAPRFPNSMNAENLVAQLEKKGMQPPEWIEQLPDGYDDMFDEPVKISRKRRDWEPEDE